MKAIFLVLTLLSSLSFGRSAQAMLPDFSGVSLDGSKVSRETLIGSPSVLIVTPTRSAAEETKAWVTQLKSEMKNTRAHDIIALDLPFFISESDAADRAKKMVPKEYWSRTWIVEGQELEKALNVPPKSGEAFVFAVSASGELLARVSGKPSREKVGKLKDTILAATPSANP